MRPGAYFLVVTAHPWYAQRLRQMQATGEGEDQSSQHQSQNLDVAYPTTFYPGVTDQDAATPIPIKGGDRLEADITLAAQPAMRLRVKVPASGEDGGQGRRSPGMASRSALSQTIFGQVEPLPMQMTAAPGRLEVEGCCPAITMSPSLTSFPDKGEGAAKHFYSRRHLRHDRALRRHRRSTPSPSPAK